MATIKTNSMLGGVVLADNPVMIYVGAGTFPDGSTFRQVVVQVEASGRNIPLRTEVSATGEEVAFDISTALRAVLHGKELHPTDVPTGNPVRYASYAAVDFTVRAWDEYLKDGEERKTDAAVNSKGNRAIAGGHWQEALYTVAMDQSAFLQSTAFTVKPASAEMVLADTPYFINSWNAKDKCPQVTLAQYTTLGSRTVSGRTLYICERNGPLNHACCIAFRNHYGVLETVCAWSKDALQVQVERKNLIVKGMPSYRPTTRSVGYATQPKQVLSLSSGPVEQDWLRWWQTEFAFAREVWLWNGQRWQSCVLELEDKSFAYNRAEPELPHFDFSLTPI